MRTWPLVLALLPACDDASPATLDATIDALVDTTIDHGKATPCASSFGNALTNSFGRLDGTILAVVPPNLQSCAQPNRTHLVVQVTMNGAAYRMVVNVETVAMHELDAALAGPAWSEGWHTGVALDYASTLGVHSPAFAAESEPVERITNQLELGARISVYATSSGGTKADSAHLIHRNTSDADGAIVVRADTAPHYLLIKFPSQVF